MPIGDKYHKLREKVANISKDVLGMYQNEAIDHIVLHGLACRTVCINGNGCIITADVKSNRIGLYVENGIVVATENG